ncbi:MAG TPA: YihY/virulence factor BrkB family protein [Cryptosporangiaceae bacterium]|nr:YihY/virulence factor BrkB family protein [Cryptosporangiaceae bacterium]
MTEAKTRHPDPADADAKDAEIPAEDAPDTPSELNRASWWGVLKRTAKEFQNDDLIDWAAALTYYSVLSIFPGLLVLASVLGLAGQGATQPLIDNLTAIAPGAARDILTGAARGLQQSGDTAGILAVVGLLGALWSASAYVGAFMRASNVVYDVREGRPIWKTLPIRLAITVVTGVLLGASALAVVLTGRLAEQIGALLGIGSTAVTIWDIAKWPVLAVLIGLLFALLYWASPNVKQDGFRWVTPGSALAVVLWVLASAGFAFYVSQFASYNKTYGTLGGVIIFFVWLWISNIAVLLGAEFDAEMQRARAIAAGHPPCEEPFMELRDTRALDDPDNC